MLRQEISPSKDQEEQNGLNYQNKKLFHMIQLQILDTESTLHYIQKKHSMNQLKETLSQIYNIYNQTEPLFKTIKASFLHQQIKKIMNCFGIIYVILMDHLENDNKKTIFSAENDEKQKDRIEKVLETEKKMNMVGQKQSISNIRHRSLGGIHLYNERCVRYIEAPLNRRLKGVDGKVITKATNEELKKMVLDEISDFSYINSTPDQPIDIFSFKFKYGKMNQIVTFHEELISIANFFKQSQNEAFQFLNKTKDQAAIIAYNNSFQDIIDQLHRQKQKKLQFFTQKIKVAFESIKSKTQKKMAEMENKIIMIEEVNHPKRVEQIDRQSQTTFNFEDEIKSLNRRLLDSEEKYKITMEFKKRELQENTMIGLQLENEIGLKNRELVYFKLKLQEKQLLVSNLNKKLRLVTESNRKFKQITKTNNSQPVSIMKDIIQSNKEETHNFLIEEEENLNQLESIRKQKKMAKKIFLDNRKASILAQKATFMKRFTQQLDHSGPKKVFPRNLSFIAEDQASDIENDDSDNISLISNKNNLLFEEVEVETPPVKKILIINENQVAQSLNSVRNSLSKSRKSLKNKITSIGESNRTSLVSNMSMNGMKGTLGQKSSRGDWQQQLTLREGESMNLNSIQFNRIQEMFKKQMSKTNSIISTSKRFSAFSNTQKSNNRSLFSDKRQTKEKNLTKPKPQAKNNYIQSYQRQNTENSLSKQSFKTSLRFNSEAEQLKKISNLLVLPEFQLCSHEITITIYSLPRQDQQTQTNQIPIRNNEEQQQSSLNRQQCTSSYPIGLNLKKQLHLNERHTTQIIVRSTTQAKLYKNKYLKTINMFNDKQNQKQALSFFKNVPPQTNQQNLEKNGFKNDVSRDMSKKKIFFNKGAKLTVQPEDKQFILEQREAQIRQERQIRKIALKCRTLQQFKARIAQIHKQKCGNNCKHLQRFIQNFLKYKQEEKPKLKMPIKNMSDHINYTTTDDERSQLPALQKKRT